MSHTATTTSTFTRTHTATHLSDVIMGSIADILGTLLIDATRLFSDWDTDQQAISAWIVEGSLRAVALECHQPDGSADPILEFPVAYQRSGEGDRQFTADRAALARYLAKLRTVPDGTNYRLYCSFNGPHSTQPGWSPATRASVDGMQSHSFGTLAGGPHANASLRYYVK